MSSGNSAGPSSANFFSSVSSVRHPSAVRADTGDRVKIMLFRIGGNDRKQRLVRHGIDLVDDQNGRDAALFDLLNQALLGGANLRARLDHEHSNIDLCNRVGHDLDHELTQRGARLVQARVSRKTNWQSSSLSTPVMRVRVVCGLLETMATL